MHISHSGVETMIYYALYTCLIYTLGFQVLKLVWVYWIRRPVIVVDRHVHSYTKLSTEF